MMSYRTIILLNYLNNIRDSINTVAYVMGQNKELDEWVEDAIYTQKQEHVRVWSRSKDNTDPRPILSELRLRKDEYELKSMVKAADLAVSAHIMAMKQPAPENERENVNIRYYRRHIFLVVHVGLILAL